MMMQGSATIGDIIGGLKAGRVSKEQLREVIRRFKLEPDLLRKAGRSIVKAVPDDPFDQKVEGVGEDYKLLKRALEEAGGSDVAEELEKDVKKGLKMKAAKWSVRELMRSGGPTPEQLDAIRDAAVNGDEENKEIARHAIEELEAAGISV